MRTIALFLPGALDVDSSRGKEAIIALAAVLHLAARLSPSPSASGVDAASRLKSSRYMPLTQLLAFVRSRRVLTG